MRPIFQRKRPPLAFADGPRSGAPGGVPVLDGQRQRPYQLFDCLRLGPAGQAQIASNCEADVAQGGVFGSVSRASNAIEQRGDQSCDAGVGDVGRVCGGSVLTVDARLWLLRLGDGDVVECDH